MTVILPNSVFLHIPKAGGSWVREVLKENKLDVRSIRSTDQEYTTNKPGSWHNVPWDDKDFIDRPNRFAFVRHPLTWYRSYWAFKVAKGNWDSTDIDVQCKSPNFNEFINNVIRFYPDGFLAWMYGFYTQHCTFVGTQEFLLEHLQYVLLEYEDVKITDFPPALNYSPQDVLDTARYTPSQVRQIMWIEREIVNTYDYH